MAGHTRIVYQSFLKKDRGFLQKGEGIRFLGKALAFRQAIRYNVREDFAAQGAARKGERRYVGRSEQAQGPGAERHRDGQDGTQAGRRPGNRAGGFRWRALRRRAGLRRRHPGNRGGRGGGVKLILLLLAVLLGGGGGLTAFLGGQGSTPQTPPQGQQQPNQGGTVSGTDWTQLLSGLGAAACPLAGTIRPTPGGWTPPWRRGPGRSTPSCWETGGTPPPLWSICAAPT